MPAQLPLTVKFGGLYEAGAEVANFSTRGMYFVTEQKLEVGTAIELVFRLPKRMIGREGVWLRCTAEVVRVGEGLTEKKFGIAAKIRNYTVFPVE